MYRIIYLGEHASAQGVDERIINVHYYYYYSIGLIVVCGTLINYFNYITL